MPGLWSGLAQAKAGQLKGQQAGEAEQRKRTLDDALRAQNEQDRQAALQSRTLDDALTRAQTVKASQPSAWVPTTQAEAEHYEEAKNQPPAIPAPTEGDKLRKAFADMKAAHPDMTDEQVRTVIRAQNPQLSDPAVPQPVSSQLVDRDDPNDPTGGTKLPYAFNPKTNTLTPITGGPTKTGGSGNGTGVVSPEQMQKDHQYLVDTNKQLKDAEQTLTPLTPVQVGFLRTSQVDAAKHPYGAFILGAAGQAAFDQLPPEWQSYLRMQRGYGTTLNIVNSRRGAEYQANLDMWLSGLAGGDKSATLPAIQQFRDTVGGTEMPQAAGRGVGAGTVPQETSGTTPVTKAEYDELAKTFSAAQLAHFVIQP